MTNASRIPSVHWKQTVNFLSIVVLFSQLSTLLCAEDRMADQTTTYLSQRNLPDLPDTLGVAGPFVGVDGDALIVAGGANFPDGVPWHPTKSGKQSLKVYHDTVYVLTKKKDPPNSDAVKDHYQWEKVAEKLPTSAAYGMSVSTSQGVLCIGGETQRYEFDKSTDKATTIKTLFEDVYLLKWDKTSKKIRVSREWKLDRGNPLPIPPLPIKLSNACAAMVDDFVYVAGGDSGEGGGKHFFRLSLAPALQKGESWKWEQLPAWDGPRRLLAIGVGQKGQFFLFSGRNIKDGHFEILHDAHCFDPKAYAAGLRGNQPDANGWKRLSDIAIGEEKPRSVMAGTGCAIGQDEILLFGGADGEILIRREEQMPKEIEKAKSEGKLDLANQLQKESNALYDDHQGFSKDILKYHVESDTWIKAGKTTSLCPVTTNLTRWNDWIVIPSGEIRPGVRSREVLLFVPPRND